MDTGGVGREQRLVGQNVDPAGQAQGGGGNQADGAGGKYFRAPVAGDPQPEPQIFGYVLLHQGFQAEVVGDPFLQLPHVWTRQNGVEFLLAEKHQLQELVAIRFQVGKQADFFQGFGRHGVGFVDQHHHLAVFAVKGDQPVLERPHDGANPGGFRQAQAKFAGNGKQNVLPGERGVGQVYDHHMGGQSLHEHAAQHGLAASHFATDLDDALVVDDGVDEGIQGRATVRPGKEELRVGGDAKGRLGETEMLQVHALPCSNYCRRPQAGASAGVVGAILNPS